MKLISFDKFTWLHGPRLILGAYIALAAAFTGYQLWVRPGSINNFHIFRASFDHLIQNADLYALHPEKHFDVYRYSPTFAFFMAPFRYLPIGISLLLWNLSNALVLYLAVRRLNLTRVAAAFVLLFILPQLLSAIQSAQSNGIIAGLMLGTFAAFEKGQQVSAALQGSLGFFVKVYGAAMGMLFVFYDRKIRFLLVGGAWGILLAILPLPFTGLRGLIEHYSEWLAQMREPTVREMKYSIMTVVEKWFGITPPEWYFSLPGLIVLLLPLLRVNMYKDRGFRVMYAGFLMVFIVVFNHMAESPTYVIAMTGVAIWSLAEPRSLLRTVVLFLAFFITGLSHSDLCPSIIRDRIIAPYGLKAVPCLLVWALAAWRLLTVKPGQLRTDYFTLPSPLTAPLTAAKTPSAAPTA